MVWDHAIITSVPREAVTDLSDLNGEGKMVLSSEMPFARESDLAALEIPEEQPQSAPEADTSEERSAAAEPAKKKSRRRPRRRRRKPEEKTEIALSGSQQGNPDEVLTEEGADIKEGIGIPPQPIAEPIETGPSDPPRARESEGVEMPTPMSLTVLSVTSDTSFGSIRARYCRT